MSAASNDRTHYLVIIALALLFACVACAATTFIAQVWMPPVVAEHGYVTRLCASVRLTSGFRAATWWSSPISNRTHRLRQPYIQSNIVCGYAPWRPGWQASGNWESAK